MIYDAKELNWQRKNAESYVWDKLHIPRSFINPVAPSKPGHLQKKRKKGLKISSRLWRRSLKKVSLSPTILQLPIEENSCNLQAAYRDYYEKKGNSKELRASALDSLAEALALEGNSTKEKIIKGIKHREKQCATARKIKFLRGKLNTGSTTMITIQLWLPIS
jgi:hypothetical protein